MKVTTKILRNNKRVLLFIDNEEITSIYLTFFSRNKRKITMAQSADELKQLIDELSYKEGVSYALSILAKRAYAPLEIERKLKERIDNLSIVEDILSYLTDRNYLSEEREKEAFILSYIRKGYGPYLILQKLKTKFSKISYDEIMSYYPQEEQLQQIIKVLNKKFSLFNPKNQKEKRKIFQYFQSKGFSLETIDLSISKNLN